MRAVVIEDGENTMCDYSLHGVASRPAKVGDELITTQFPHTITTGFAAIDEPNVAVCLRPGTELVFDHAPECWRPLMRWRRRQLPSTVARFRQVNPQRPDVHHDALEFSDGTIVLLNRLWPGQRASVLQLPVEIHKAPAPQVAGNLLPTALEDSTLLS
jgi:hypothetical protein